MSDEATPASRHTPGPWVIDNTDPLLFGRKQGNGTEPIGYVYGPSFPERSEVGQRALANARLVAAAPDLLNALRSLLRHAERMQEVMDEECGIRFRDDGPMAMARDAMARAVGAAAACEK